MGVMCSLLGHDYGDADVERERTEQGEEVVRTAKRVERCRNCNHERTVSENTEVTALEAAAGVVREPDGTVVAATTETSEAVGKADGGEQAGVEGNLRLSDHRKSSISKSLRTSEDERSESNGSIAIEKIEGRESALVPDDTDENEQAAVDELPDETERIDEVRIDRVHNDEPVTRNRPNRAPGEWPAEPDAEPTPPSETPQSESDSLSSSGSLAAGKLRAGRWPGETEATANARQGNSGDNEHNGGESSAAAGTSTRVVAGGSFACGSCGFSAAVADSPLRAGDICPGCGHGYLAWETRKG